MSGVTGRPKYCPDNDGSALRKSVAEVPTGGMPLNAADEPSGASRV